MAFPTKIATCCHCGTRAALVLDRTRHSLRCDACGAPLTALRRVPAEPVAASSKPGKKAVDHRKAVRGFTPFAAIPASTDKPGKRKKKSSKNSRRKKSWLRDWAEEAIDLVEDIFD